MDSLHPVGGVDQSVAAQAADRLCRFRAELYGCLGWRADELFELTDALLCAEGRSLTRFSGHVECGDHAAVSAAV